MMRIRIFSKDSAGEIILPGDLVCYNRSGDVCLGRVQRVRPVITGRYEYHTKHNITIDNLDDGTLSTVRNPSGIRIIG